MQMPESPWSVNWISPVSCFTVFRSASSEALPRQRRPLTAFSTGEAARTGAREGNGSEAFKPKLAASFRPLPSEPEEGMARPPEAKINLLAKTTPPLVFSS